MDNKRFQDIYGAVTAEVRDTSSAFQTIAKRYSNDGYDEILKRLIQANVFEQNRTWTLTTTAGTRSYPAPFDLGEVVYALDTTNSREVTPSDEYSVYHKYGNMNWFAYQSSINTTGVPLYMIVRADSNLMNQPATSNLIRIVSSSSNDTSQSVFLKGISGSAEFYETVSLNGTTSASSTNSYDYLIEAVKSTTTTGKVTITYITDATTAAVITPASYFERYKVIEFYYVPAGAYTYTIRYRRLIKPMTQDNDVPIVDVAQGIEYFAIARSWEYKRQLMTATHFMNKFEAWYTEYVNQRSKNGVQQFDVIPYPREY